MFVLCTGGKPPKDSTSVVLEKLFVTPEVLAAVGFFSVLGILLAIIFLGVNVVHRKTRSDPRQSFD